MRQLGELEFLLCNIGCVEIQILFSFDVDSDNFDGDRFYLKQMLDSKCANGILILNFLCIDII